jgi:hypothetical protein
MSFNQPTSVDTQLQHFKVRLNRTLTAPQAGQFYADGQRVISVPCTFYPLGVDEQGQQIPQMVRMLVGDKGYVMKDITGMSASLALPENMYDDLNDTEFQAVIIEGKARINTNARKQHGREGQLWIENLSGDFDLMEAEGQVVAATEAELDASLAVGRVRSEQGLKAALARRNARQEAVKPNLRTQDQVAADLAKGSRTAGTMSDKAARAAGLNIADIPKTLVPVTTAEAKFDNHDEQ